MPLAELISSVYDKGVTTKTVQGKWQALIDNFGTEIEVLINTPIEEIKKVDSAIAPGIEAFRNKTLDIMPGGGGQYGKISFNGKLEEREEESLTTLDSFCK